MLPSADAAFATVQSDAAARPESSGDMADMPGMSDMAMQGMSPTGILGNYPMTRDSSGTSWQPDEAEHRGLHEMAGDWMLMGHLTLWGIYDWQSGPRGDDKGYLAGMAMGAARRDFADGDSLNLRLMLSPDPFMGKSGYPLLLASGETANGTAPLIDRQHPHDLVMEMSAAYDHRLSNANSAFFYAGYPGEPALGPPAFMHRPSGMDIPDAPITHHWLDSTHIAFGVATAGFVQDAWKVEVSQFTGREPDEYRFDFDRPRFDSTSARLSYNPDEHWSLQTSWGALHSPEQLDPEINEQRLTASAIYATRFSDESSFAATFAWGLKDLSNGTRLNALLSEAEYKPDESWTAFARAEWEQNNELAASGAVARVGEVSLGGIRDWQIADHWKIGLGALYAFDFVPATLTPTYGADPHGTMVFTRLVAE
ncbi:MAG TPA: hypothetical protein VGF97_11325 [Rhizomicrobium sp.]